MAKRALSPSARRERQRLVADRSRALALLVDGSRADSPAVDGTILVDGSWYNAHYWLRFGLMLRALGLKPESMVLLLGPYSRRESRNCAEVFNIVREHILDIDRRDAAATAEARRLLKDTQTPDDVLNWKLPHDFPPAQLYDSILKEQRKASLDLDDPQLEGRVAKALTALDVAVQTLDMHQPSLLLLSHALNYELSALSWIAAKRGIATVVLFGNFGTQRFWRLTRPEDVFDWCDRLEREDFEALEPSRADALAEAGGEHVTGRVSGKSTDIGAIHAFQNDTISLERTSVTSAMKWDAETPIIGVYVSNLFDYPHCFGFDQYRDFADWLEVSLPVMAANRKANWLLRAHPCDVWYGGQSMVDLLPPELPAHIGICPKEWNGAAVKAACDAVVTCHGTAGLEYAADGKPVLLSGKGWYHDYGFAIWPKTRQEYLDILSTPWWRDANSAEIRRRSLIVSGLSFCMPGWQCGLVFGDDSEQDALWSAMESRLSEYPDTVDQECELLSAWFASGERFFHTFKMMRADSYCMSNVTTDHVTLHHVGTESAAISAPIDSSKDLSPPTVNTTAVNT
jgi:hypothetical protein